MTPLPKPDKTWAKMQPREKSRLKYRRAQYRAKHPSKAAKRISQQLREIKNWMGETDSQLAARFGVTRVTMNRWLNTLGYLPSNGNIETLRRLHREFKLKYGEPDQKVKFDGDR